MAYSTRPESGCGAANAPFCSDRPYRRSTRRGPASTPVRARGRHKRLRPRPDCSSSIASLGAAAVRSQ